MKNYLCKGGKIFIIIVLILMVVSLLFPNIVCAQKNVSAKEIRADSIRARVPGGFLNMKNVTPYKITVNDTLLEDYINERIEFPLYAPNTSFVDPQYSFTLSPNSGIGSNSINRVNITINSLESMSWRETETISFKNFRPSTDSTFDLGRSTQYWRNLYTYGINDLIYPDVDGANGQVLTTDGAGVLSFTNSGLPGTYTPTVINWANMSQPVPFSPFRYVVNGNQVTVYGTIQIQPLASPNPTNCTISLPIASNFTNAITDCIGHVTMVTNVAGTSISGNVTAGTITDGAIIEFISSTTASRVYRVSFNYVILP